MTATDFLQAMCLLVVIGILLLQRRRLGVLEIYVAVYAYFFLGPYIAIRIGLPVYVGINQSHLDIATLIFFVSLLGLIAGSLTPGVATVRTFDIRPPSVSHTLLDMATLLPAQLLIFYGLFRVIGMWGAAAGLNKKEIVDMVGALHYPTLTLVPCMLFAYMAFVERRDRPHRLLWVTIGTFSIYAVLTNERDFILLTVPVYFWATGRQSIRPVHAVLIAVPMVIVFATLSQGRNLIFDYSVTASILNQGSNLMAVSQTAAYIAEGGDHIMGLSYLSAFVNALTLGLIRIWGPGAAWLSEYYSNGVGGYGFSLEAEAYLNFGIPGVFVIFFLIARYYRVMERFAISGSRLGVLLRLHFAFFLLYGVRGEFLMVLKSAQYAVIIYLVVAAIMGRGVLVLTSVMHHEGSRGHPAGVTRA